MSCVYKIGFEDCDEFYVGSSIDLHKRKHKHKSDYYREHSKEYNKKLYLFIRENYDWESVIFEVLEHHDIVLDTIELRKREQHFIDELKPTLNKSRAYNTEEQKKQYDYDRMKVNNPKYYQENKEAIKSKSKIYYQENKEKINKKCDCECGSKYAHRNKAEHFKTKKHQDYLANLNKEN